MTPYCYDTAVDLGTGYVRVVARGRGGMHEEPSVVRISRSPLTLRAVGAQALAPIDTGTLSFLSRPLSKGVVVDVEEAGWLLSTALRRARGLCLRKPSVLICVPSDTETHEAGRLRAALEQAGVQRVKIVPEPLAAAVGAGLDMASHHAQLVVDLGDGVTDVTVIRDGQIDIAGAVRTACGDLRWAIVRAVAEEHGVLLPPLEAQRALEALGLGDDGAGSDSIEVRGCRGTDLAPVRARPTRREIQRALNPLVEPIVGAVCAVWRRLTPETSCEVIETGMCVTGGGAMLRGLARRLQDATGLGVHVASDPARAVIRGASRMAGLQ